MLGLRAIASSWTTVFWAHGHSPLILWLAVVQVLAYSLMVSKARVLNVVFPFPNSRKYTGLPVYLLTFGHGGGSYIEYFLR